MTEPCLNGPDEDTHHFGISHSQTPAFKSESSPHYATIRRPKEKGSPPGLPTGLSGKVGTLLLSPLVGLADHTARSLPPDIAAPSHHSLNSASRSEGGPDVEEEDGLAGRLWRTAVVVDNVAHLLLFAVYVSGDVPVVAVEGGLGAASLLALHS